MKLAILTAAVALFGAASAVPTPWIRNSDTRDVHVHGVRFVPRELTYQAVENANKQKRDDLNDLAARDDDLFKRGEFIKPKIINRHDHDDASDDLLKREPQIPEEVAVKSDNGDIVQYIKRQDDEPIPEEIPVHSEDGQIKPFVKRQDPIPAEVAVQSLNGEIVVY